MTMSEAVIPFPCPVCKQALVQNVIDREMTYGGQVSIQECKHCGLAFTWPRLPVPQGVYTDYPLDAWDKKYGAIERGERLHDRHNNYLQECELIAERVPRQSKILDVGCNAGWLLGYLKKRFDQVEGVEPSPFLAARTRARLNVTVHQCFVHEVQQRDEYFDAMTATDVIEHINPEDIDVFLEGVRKVLKPGGFFFVKTPNLPFVHLKARIIKTLPLAVRKVMLKAQDVWDAKEHVIHWNEKTLATILTSHGLKPVRIFVPKPVETRGSPLGAVLARKAIFQLTRLLGGGHRVPTIAQDVFIIAQKI